LERSKPLGEEETRMPLRERIIIINSFLRRQKYDIPPEEDRTLTVGRDAIIGDLGAC
jgi:hypothetical protein